MDIKYKINKVNKINKIYNKRLKDIGLLIVKLMDIECKKDFILSKYKKKIVKLINRIKKVLESNQDHGNLSLEREASLTIILENTKKIYRYLTFNL